MTNRNYLFGMLVLASVLLQSLPVRTQTNGPIATLVPDEVDAGQVHALIIQQASNTESQAALEKLFGNDAAAASAVLLEGSERPFDAVRMAAGEKAKESLKQLIEDRKQKRSSPAVGPQVRSIPPIKPIRKGTPGRKKLSSSQNARPSLWRQLAFGFQPLFVEDEKPDVKMTETDKAIKAEGSDKKSFETKDAKGTRTQTVETTYTKDGKIFDMEIRDKQVIEAVSKPDGKSFRRELAIEWGADVAACPDANGVTSGTGKAKVMSKTTYVENGVSVTMTSAFDLDAKLTGYVNDKAEMTHYDLQLDAYLTNSGYEDALSRGLIKEIKINDGKYGLRYNIKGNTIEVSDGQYGGYRKGAKLGVVTASKLTSMSDEQTIAAGGAFGPMIPSIWNSANEMYKTAERSWKNYGCFEVTCKAPKTTLKQGEEVDISTETAHLQDGTQVDSALTAEAYNGDVTPESQSGKAAKFRLQQNGDSGASFFVESISKRGIGRGDVAFKLEKEGEETEAGVWSGTIKAERKQREEKEKRSGANLAENGGNIETSTTVQLQLTGRLDRTVEATNAYLANISGIQKMVDYEYDRYKIDEGYCGPNAIPYKGPKEITRTSTTTTNYNKEIRVYVEIGPTSGTITFSLPDVNGTTVHKYVHRSPCSDHDRTNTNDSTNEDAPTLGGSFSYSFPIDGSRKIVNGSIEVRGEDGSVSTYSWELKRQ